MEQENQMEIPLENTGNGEMPKEKPERPEKEPRQGKRTLLFLFILNMVLLAGLAVLYYLHFAGNKKPDPSATQSLASYQPMVSNQPGNGEVLFVNMDTIQKYYALVDILTQDIEMENKRLEATFSNRQKTFQQKVEQFQKNLRAQILTEQQALNTEQMLTGERDQLAADFEAADAGIQARQLAALRQVMDSIVLATQIVNIERNASYVFSYQYGGQLLHADPTKDITKEVIDRLNAYYQEK